jgi:hypothetical protein
MPSMRKMASHKSGSKALKLTPRERKPNDRRIAGPYAGAVCPKCGQGMNHKQNITLSEKEEERDRKRYGQGICDDCKTERQVKTKI